MCRKTHQSINQSSLDAANAQVGSCSHDDIAVRLATRVIGHYPGFNGLLIDCGYLALSHGGKDAFNTGYCKFQDHPELRFVHNCSRISIDIDR